MFNARKQHHGRRILDHQRVAIHTGRAAIANHPRHAGVAAVVHRGIENPLEDQPLLVVVLVEFALCAPSAPSEEVGRRAWRAAAQRRSQPAAPEAAIPPNMPPADLCSMIRTFSDCPLRSGEPLHHDIVGPGREGPANPLAALVCPVNLYLGAFEIDRAEIVLDRRGFRRIQAHRESRASAEPPPGGMGLLCHSS